jgi:hypothetical protein
VDKKREREILLIAKQSKTPGINLINNTLALVFSENELAESTGMGLKRHKGNEKKPILNSIKLEAVKEYVNFQCKRNEWDVVPPTIFNITVTNKIGNIRKKMKKSPKLKSTN